MAPALKRAPADAPAASPAPAEAANDAAAPAFVERRQAERRGMDRLRAEALQTIITQVEDRNFGGLKNRVSLKPRLPVARLALVFVALAAGGIAALLATQSGDPAPATAPLEQVAVPAMKVLVAATEIAPGQKLGAESIVWQDWPAEGLQPDFITSEAQPGAVAETAGATARATIYPGEPIRAQKLTRTGAGYLAAILEPGTRGVSIPVSAETASGGFIVPGDAVDVVLTVAVDGGNETQTILQNVRVLAIDSQLGPEGSGSEESASPEAARGFSEAALATLALTPTESELIINATDSGALSLVLRPAAEPIAAAEAEERAANAAIRMSSPFWRPAASGGGASALR